MWHTVLSRMPIILSNAIKTSEIDGLILLIVAVDGNT
jgi:hypothetical protein